MKKFMKSKFDNQLETHKIFKKKLNLVKHKKNLYDPKNHTGTIILREQDTVSLNNKLILNDIIFKMKKRQKEDPNVQVSKSLRSKQNENSSSKLQLSNIVDSNYSKDFNGFSQSVNYSSLSHCNSNLLDSDFCSDSSHNIAGQSHKSRQKQLKEVVFGYSHEKQNVPTIMNNIERDNMACASETNRDVVPPRQELEQNNLQTENTPANNILKPKATKSKRRKGRKRMWTRKTRNKIEVSNFVESHDENDDNNSGEKSDIIVTNFAYDRTLVDSINEKRKNEDSISESDEDCVITDYIPFQRRMRTRSMGRMEHIPWKVNHQIAQENTYKKKHIIEVQEETIFQQNLQMTTHFHSKYDTFSCNLHDNNSSMDSATKGNRKRQRNLDCSRGERHRGLTSQLQKNTDIAETILQNNLQHLVDSNLKDDCDISMKVNQTNEYKVNKSLKTDNSKMNVHNSMEKEIIESECHIEIRKTEQNDLLKNCESNAIETTKKTFVSKTIKERKTIKSFKAITGKRKNKVMVNQYSRKKELIIPLVKLEDLSLAKLIELLHIPHNIKNKIEMLQKKKAQYTVRNTSTEECTIIRKQYEVTQIKNNVEFDGLHNNPKKCKDQGERNFCENRGESTSSAQQINANLECDEIVSLDQHITEQMAKDNSSTLSSLDTEEYFTKCQQVAENEHSLNKSQESVLNKEHTHSNETILEQSNTEIDKHKVSDNEADIGEMLENRDSELQTNKLLQNIYKFYLKNKIKKVNSNNLDKFMRMTENNVGITSKVAICSKCKQVFNLLRQFSGKTNFTKDEKIQIECTLCNVHIYSLSCFQQHLMDTHLQCEQTSKMKTNKKYAVEIIQFNINNSNKAVPIYECCCCLKAFKYMSNFKRHVMAVHFLPNFQYTPGIFSTKYIATDLETDVLKKNLIPETVNNTAEFPNGVQDSTNVLNNTNLNVNTEESQVETNETELEQKEALESSNLNSTNNQNNQKRSKKIRKTSLYQCKHCNRVYKRKNSFLSHVSKHTANLDNSEKSEKTFQEILDNDPSKVESNIHFLYDRYNNALPPVALKDELEKSECKRIVEETSIENFKNSDHGNTDKKRLLERKNAFDFQCLLHVNCTKTVRTGEKRQQFIKCNVNISKKLKPDSTVQQTLKNGSKDNLFTNYMDQPNFTFNGDTRAVSNEQKEIQCKICYIKFNSEQILKEHMFLVHDSSLQDREVLNLLDLSHSDNNTAEGSVSAEDNDENSRSKDNTSTGEEEGRMYENVICEMLSDCSINKRNKNWRCNLCKENFNLIRNYLRHKYYVHNDLTVVHVCENCKKVLTSVAMVNIHKCTNVTSWSCSRCNLEFVNGTYLAQHNINHHFEIVGPHTCDVCETSFLTQYMLEKHRSVHSPTNDCNNVNNLDSNTGRYTENDSNDSTEDTFEYVSENDKSSGSVNENRTDLNRPAEAANIFSNTFSNSNILLESDTEEMFKCKICDIVCLTRKQMKSHLENWHGTKAEVCELCNRLYLATKLMEHLMDCHIVTSEFNSMGNNTDAQLDYNRTEDFQKNVVDHLGLKRLITLYEYQRFNDPKNNSFNCMVCLVQFANTQSYRLHYLKFHDRVCLLCNIEFKHQYQAFKHKIKIHVSTNSYLWVVEELIASILQFNKNGSTLENVILQYSERRIQDSARSQPEMYSLNSDNN